MENDLGTLEEGKSADVLLLDATSLENIRKTEYLTGNRGRYIFDQNEPHPSGQK